MEAETIPLRRRRKEARPGELLEAALEVFTEHGFAAARLDEIAQRAGASKGTIYLYFESKEALFKAAVEAAITPALEAAEAVAADGTVPAAESLRRFVRRWWQATSETALAGLPKLLVAESGNFPELARWFHDNVVFRAQRALAAIIARGVEGGEFRPVEPLVAARVVLAPIFAYLLWRRAFGACACDLPAPETYLATALEMLTLGLVREVHR